jgi:hypothetical protein
MEVTLNIFLTSASDEGEYIALCTGRIYRIRLAGWAQEPVCTLRRAGTSIAPARIRTPTTLDALAKSTELSRLSECSLLLRGRVSKKVTNVSWTAVMNLIWFICVSLGSSTVQLHDSLGSRRASCSEAGFSSQNGNPAWGIYYRRTAFCCTFLEAKGLNIRKCHS